MSEFYVTEQKWNFKVVFNRPCCHGNYGNRKFTCQSKSFISIFFTYQVSACELQLFSCHDLENDILTNCQNCVQPTLIKSVTYSRNSWLTYPHETWFKIASLKLSRGRAGFGTGWVTLFWPPDEKRRYISNNYREFAGLNGRSRQSRNPSFIHRWEKCQVDIGLSSL